MTRFDCQFTLVCPSDWTEETVRKYLNRILPTPEEKETLRVQPSAEVQS